ncbi:hypothetical protein HK104_006468 [Borealophlyctis nickersoniae]|nr:hypothetical protein HK104_006468 [Borealophlyctis nickersoniae]
MVNRKKRQKKSRPNSTGRPVEPVETEKSASAAVAESMRFAAISSRRVSVQCDTDESDEDALFESASTFADLGVHKWGTYVPPLKRKLGAASRTESSPSRSKQVDAVAVARDNAPVEEPEIVNNDHRKELAETDLSTSEPCNESAGSIPQVSLGTETLSNDSREDTSPVPIEHVSSVDVEHVIMCSNEQADRPVVLERDTSDNPTPQQLESLPSIVAKPAEMTSPTVSESAQPPLASQPAQPSNVEDESSEVEVVDERCTGEALLLVPSHTGCGVDIGGTDNEVIIQTDVGSGEEKLLLETTNGNEAVVEKAVDGGEEKSLLEMTDGNEAIVEKTTGSGEEKSLLETTDGHETSSEEDGNWEPELDPVEEADMDAEGYPEGGVGETQLSYHQVLAESHEDIVLERDGWQTDVLPITRSVEGGGILEQRGGEGRPHPVEDRAVGAEIMLLPRVSVNEGPAEILDHTLVMESVEPTRSLEMRSEPPEVDRFAPLLHQPLSQSTQPREADMLYIGAAGQNVASELEMGKKRTIPAAQESLPVGSGLTSNTLAEGEEDRFSLPAIEEESSDWASEPEGGAEMEEDGVLPARIFGEPLITGSQQLGRSNPVERWPTSRESTKCHSVKFHSIHCDKCGNLAGTREPKAKQYGPPIGDEEYYFECRLCSVVSHSDCTSAAPGRSTAAKALAFVCRHCTEVRTPYCTICLQKQPPRNQELNDEFADHTEGTNDMLMSSAFLFRCQKCKGAAHLGCLSREYAQRASSKSPAISLDVCTHPDPHASGTPSHFVSTGHCVDCMSYQRVPKEILNFHRGPPSTEIKNVREQRFLVRWKGLSYRHLHWVRETWLRMVAVELVTQFLARVENEQNQKEATSWSKSSNMIVNPEWEKVHRILDLRRKDGVTGTQAVMGHGSWNSMRDEDIAEVLVKWRGLDLGEATWEPWPEPSAPDLDDFRRALNACLVGYQINSKIAGQLRWQLIREGKIKAGFEARDLQEHPPWVAGGELKKWQIDGINWMWRKWKEGKPAILADEGGLGRSTQIVSLISTLHHVHGTFPAIIITSPCSVSHWVSLFEEWAPHLRVVAYAGSVASRSMIRAHDMFANPVEPTEGIRAHIVVADVAALREDGGRAVFGGAGGFEVAVADDRLDCGGVGAIRRTTIEMDGKWRILCTESPDSVSTEDTTRGFLKMVDFMDPDMPAVVDLKRKYATNGSLISDELSQLRAIVAPHYLKRSRDDFMPDLPSVHERFVPVSLTTTQMRMYQNALKFFKPALLSQPLDERTLSHLVSSLIKLTSHPYLLPSVRETALSVAKTQNLDAAGMHKLLLEASGKFLVLHAMMRHIRTRGGRVVVCASEEMVDLLEESVEGKKLEAITIVSIMTEQYLI